MEIVGVVEDGGRRETKSFGEILIVILYKNIPNFQGILSVRHLQNHKSEGRDGGNKNSAIMTGDYLDF